MSSQGPSVATRSQEDPLPPSEQHLGKRSRLEAEDDTLTTDQAAAITSTSADDGHAAADIPLTDTLRAAMEVLNTRKSDILANIDHLAATGAAFLDQAKAAFLQRMEGLKQELQANHDQQTDVWAEMSSQQLSDDAKLHHVQQCVEALGLQVMSKP